MANGNGYRAKYDYVEVTVERRGDRWRLIMKDTRYGDLVEHDEDFDSADDAKEEALALVEHHIFIQHNDTLVAGSVLRWQEF